VKAAVREGAWALAALAMVVGAGCAARDGDGDGAPDTVRVGNHDASVFLTRGSAEAPSAHWVAPGWQRVMDAALRDGDFVGDALHRDRPREAQALRDAAVEIVGDAATPRQKAERLLAWMDGHWDFSVERSTVNAAALLKRRQGMCESSGFVVGMLEVLGIKSREVNVAQDGFFPDIAVEAWLDGHWRVLHVFDPPRRVDERSIVEMLPGRERNACIVYYWRDDQGRTRRTKIWYDQASAPLFRSA
jgi:hypothetical protein